MCTVILSAVLCKTPSAASCQSRAPGPLAHCTAAQMLHGFSVLPSAECTLRTRTSLGAEDTETETVIPCPLELRVAEQRPEQASPGSLLHASPLPSSGQPQEPAPSAVRWGGEVCAWVSSASRPAGLPLPLRRLHPGPSRQSGSHRHHLA